jgi:hypothetical protein
MLPSHAVLFIKKIIWPLELFVTTMYKSNSVEQNPFWEAVMLSFTFRSPSWSLQISQLYFISISHSPACSMWTVHIVLIFHNFPSSYQLPCSPWQCDNFHKVSKPNCLWCSCPLHCIMCLESDVVILVKYHMKNVKNKDTHCISFQMKFVTVKSEYPWRKFSFRFFYFLFSSEYERKFHNDMSFYI